MVPGIPLKGPPRPPARRLLPLPLLLLAVMAGKGRADMGCYDAGGGGYWLSDPSKCWATEINAAFNGQLAGCYSGYDNAVWADGYYDCKTTADNINKDPRYTGPAIGCLSWNSKADCEDGAKKLQLILNQYLPCWDPRYTGPDPCTTTTNTKTTTTKTTTTATTVTTTTATTTTTTTVTTTTPTCNGKIDPAQCLSEYSGKCTDIVIGELVRGNCPVMCDTCTAAASTTTVTTRTKSTTSATPKTASTITTPPAATTAGLPAFAYGAIAGGALLLVLGIFAVYWCLRKQKLKRLQTRYGHDAADDDDDVQLLELKSSTTASTNTADYFDPQMTLQRKAITLGAVIGEGNFGKVHAGTAKDPRRGGGKIAVAIKSPSAPARLEFEAEMEIMGQLTRLGGHPHIVGVVGCVYGNRPLLVLEFCPGGSLKAALTAVRTFKADGGDGGAGAPRSVARFGNAGLATCGHQVALAMAFLEQHSLLHRDLAARNVLLTGQQQQLECKLADFGLSRRVAPGSDYYRRTVGASAAIPVRWMAPETLEDGVSTISSDKWSFGVLLWEIYSLGLRPYIGVANHEITNHLRKGHRLEQPRGCPDEVYAGVMQPCWAASPAARPAFAVIGQRLHGLIATTDA